MAAVHLTPDDLAPFAPDIDTEKAQVMIEDAIATAAVIAPCILSEDFVHEAAAKAILRAAILRWNDSGSGAVTQVSAGSFQQTIDNRNPRKSMFWPSEIVDLQKLCNISVPGRRSRSIRHRRCRCSILSTARWSTVRRVGRRGRHELPTTVPDRTGTIRRRW